MTSNAATRYAATLSILVVCLALATIAAVVADGGARVFAIIAMLAVVVVISAVIGAQVTRMRRGSGS